MTNSSFVSNVIAKDFVEAMNSNCIFGPDKREIKKLKSSFSAFLVPTLNSISIFRQWQVRMSYSSVNPLNPKAKIWILICCPYSFPTEVVGRSWSNTIK